MRRKAEFVYKVHIAATNREEYFTSVAAIYDSFEVSDLGISLRKLWEQTITPTHPFTNGTCTISKHPLRRKKHLPLPE
jgi:hypothetical protein